MGRHPCCAFVRSPGSLAEIRHLEEMPSFLSTPHCHPACHRSARIDGSPLQSRRVANDVHAPLLGTFTICGCAF